MALSLPTGTSILLTGGFAAPRHALYRAHTEPDLVRRWWGGGEGVTVVELDLRVGGAWRFTVTGDGYVAGQHGVYREVVPDTLVRCTEVDDDGPQDAAAVCTYAFADGPRGSTLSLLTELPTAADRDALLDSGMEEGVASSWAQLAQVARSLG